MRIAAAAAFDDKAQSMTSAPVSTLAIGHDTYDVHIVRTIDPPPFEKGFAILCHTMPALWGSTECGCPISGPLGGLTDFKANRGGIEGREVA